MSVEVSNSTGGILEWKFGQVFGDRSPVEEVTEVDIVSAIEFDDSGDYIAAGDRGGRVVIFERSKAKKAVAEYKFFAEFQSHEPEFDYLKSLEIEEKINKIRWCKKQNTSQFLLTTNDKTIKLWKVHERKHKSVAPTKTNGSLKLPNVNVKDTSIISVPRRIYSNAHAYHINSVSLNSDGETFLSSDDLRINLWNFGISDQSFNIVDIKPTNMEELTEVITTAEFHPMHCNIFMYSSSKGTIKLGDMRNSALCDAHSKIFEDQEDQVNRSFFSEIISSISDVKFTKDGRYIVSRDYLNLKIWDLNMEAKPVKVIPIHEHIRSKLCDLYENDCIFDKFECTLSGDGNYMLTGSYHNNFHIFDQAGKYHETIEASKFTKGKHGSAIKGKVKKAVVTTENIDFGKKILHSSWHPKENVIAIAASNNLFIYGA